MPMLDFTEPMMIEGMPETEVIGVRLAAMLTNSSAAIWEGDVLLYGNRTRISFQGNGWITSTTYSTSRVINRSVHEAQATAKELAGVDEMRDSPLWGAF